MNLYVQEDWVNVTRGYHSGSSDVYESFTDNAGELYRSLQREYGRCTGAVHADTQTGTKKVGWVFVKRQKYDDCNETYLLETWVTLHDAPPTTEVTYHYHAA